MVPEPSVPNQVPHDMEGKLSYNKTLALNSLTILLDIITTKDAKPSTDEAGEKPVVGDVSADNPEILEEPEKPEPLGKLELETQS